MQQQRMCDGDQARVLRSRVALWLKQVSHMWYQKLQTV